MNEKIERFKDIPQLKREIIAYLFENMSRKERDRWFQFKGEFVYENVEYNLECECKWDNQIFSYRNLFIEHKQQVIDVDELVRNGQLQ